MVNSVSSLNLAADAVAGTVTHLSLHTDDPGGTGADEVTGGTYARVAKAYDEADGGETDIVSPAVFNVPAETEVTHWGAWEDTTFRFGGALAAPQPVATAGTYGLNTAPYAAADPA